MKHIFLFTLFAILHQQIFCQSNLCDDAILLCDKATFNIAQMNQSAEIGHLASCWSALNGSTPVTILNWKIAEGGDLDFTITPQQIEDDLDFVIFRQGGNEAFCDNLVESRCMASGRIIGGEHASSMTCIGKMGLRNTETDVIEKKGCIEGDNNFLKTLSTNAEEQYWLIVRNISSNKGFTLDFSGTTSFQSFTEGCHDDLVDISEIEQSDLSIGGVYPNPVVNKEAFIEIVTDEATSVNLSIFALNGQLVKTIEEKTISQGKNNLSFVTERLSSGTYFLEVKAGEAKVSKRFIIVNPKDE